MTKKNVRVSTSFSLDQSILLDEILSIMLRGGDPKMLRNNRAFGSLCQTAKSLRRRAENPTEKASTPPASIAAEPEAIPAQVAPEAAVPEAAAS